MAENLNNTIVVDLRGDQEVFFALVSLPNAVIDRVAKTAFRRPAERIRDAAQTFAPVSFKGSHGNPPGFLKKNIKVRPLKTRGTFRVGVRIGTDPIEYKGPAFYAYFQEYGYHIGKRPWRSHTSKAYRAERIQALRNSLASLRRTDPGVLTEKANAKRLKQIKSDRSSLADALRAQNDKRKEIPGKFFFRRAFDANKNICAAEMKANIIEAIKIETDKIAKQFTKKILNPTVKGAAQSNRAVRLLNATDKAVSVDDSIAGFLAG